MKFKNITSEEKVDIIKRYESGMSSIKIGKIYDVSGYIILARVMD